MIVRRRVVALSATLALTTATACSHWYGRAPAETAVGGAAAAGIGYIWFSDNSIDSTTYSEIILGTALVVALIAIPYEIHQDHVDAEEIAEIEARHRGGGGGGDWQPSSTDPCDRCLEVCTHDNESCTERCEERRERDPDDNDSTCDLTCQQDDRECRGHCGGIYTSDQGQRVCTPAQAGLTGEAPPPDQQPPPAVPDVNMCAGGDLAALEPPLGTGAVTVTVGGYSQYSAASACAETKMSAFHTLKQSPRYELQQYVIYAPCCACHYESTGWHCTETASAVGSQDQDKVFVSFGAGTSDSNEASATQYALDTARQGCGSSATQSTRVFGCISDTKQVIGGTQWACFASATCVF